MAQYAFTFSSGDTVTPTKLNNARTVSDIVNADISGAAAIAGTKIAPDFGSQNVVTSGLEVIGSATQPSGDFVYSSTVSSTGARVTSVSGHATNNVSNAIVRYSNNTTSQTFAACLNLAKSNTTTAGTHVAVVDEQPLSAVSAFGSDGTNFVNSATIGFSVDGAVSAGSVPGSINFATRAAGSTTSAVTRMRINSSGDLMAQTTVPVDVTTGTADGFTVLANGQVHVSRNNSIPLFLRRRSSNGQVAQFRRDTTEVGNISVTTTATAFNTSSDYRLKQNVEPMTGGLAKLAQLKPSTFEFKSEPTVKVDGFIAHEVQEVVPIAVTGEKDGEEMQGLDHSKLVPVLVAAVQELSAKIAALEAA
jgi:hypothetical protein